MKNIGGLLEQGHSGLIKKIGELNNALSYLRFEGKPLFGRNLKKTQGAFQAFKEELHKDMVFEEEVLFPYLEKHLPKLDFMVHILGEEHWDLRNNVQVFSNMLEELAKSGYGSEAMAIVAKLQKKASYLNYFLHNHTWAENESVYRVIDEELKSHEKDELKKRYQGKLNEKAA